ncbi:MAG: ribonuclease III [Treponema sp. CETP13]|nr:MAG: ribonuclease III [Treponema sp. CETP13]
MKTSKLQFQQLSHKRILQLENFQKKISIHFNNINLLDYAFHHRSYSNEVFNYSGNNERLEFLGDSVLGLACATYLFKTMEDHPEGDLAKIKSVVVSEDTLAIIAVKIGINKCLSLGKGEENSGGREKKAILADATEAVFGAYYIDSGFEAAEKLVLELLIPEIDKVRSNKHHKDYKTLLQEFYQKKYKVCPRYEIVKKTGPDHDRTYWVSVHLKNDIYGPKSGKSKKEAEQNVAKFTWNQLTANNT